MNQAVAVSTKNITPADDTMHVVKDDARALSIDTFKALLEEMTDKTAFVGAAAELMHNTMNKSKSTLPKTVPNTIKGATFGTKTQLWEFFFDDKKQVLGIIKNEGASAVAVSVIDLTSDGTKKNALSTERSRNRNYLDCEIFYTHPAKDSEEWLVIEKVKAPGPAPTA